MRVIKRDGREVPYDRGRIASAVLKAMVGTGEGSESDSERIAQYVEEEMLKSEVFAVEGIQDLVETALMQNGYYRTAKAYCLYREKRSNVREANSRLMKGIDEIVNADARKSNAKRENANIDGNTPMGAMLQIGSLCARAYNEFYLLRPEHAKAYREGRYHIHDCDFYALTMTCCQIDIEKLLAGGFSTGHGHLREPQSIQSYAALAAIAIQANQNDVHGGQSIPNFDYGMAKGVAKSFRRNFLEKLEDALDDIVKWGERPNPAFTPELVRTAEVLSGEKLKLCGNEKLDETLVSMLPNVTPRANSENQKESVQSDRTRHISGNGGASS